MSFDCSQKNRHKHSGVDHFSMSKIKNIYICFWQEHPPLREESLEGAFSVHIRCVENTSSNKMHVKEFLHKNCIFFQWLHVCCCFSVSEKSLQHHFPARNRKQQQVESGCTRCGCVSVYQSTSMWSCVHAHQQHAATALTLIMNGSRFSRCRLYFVTFFADFPSVYCSQIKKKTESKYDCCMQSELFAKRSNKIKLRQKVEN